LIVIDASAFTGFLLGEPSACETLVRLTHTDDPEPLHAPELLELETLNALRRLARRDRLSAQRATCAVELLDATPLLRYPHAPLRARVWDLRNELSAYDASYLALAEAIHGSVLLTADQGLAVRARDSLGTERVNFLD
jgi:predicted nucleic acid-binding protein